MAVTTALMTEEDVVPVWLRPPPPPPHRPAPPPYMLPGGGGVCRPPCSAHGHLLRLPTEHVTDVGGQPAPLYCTQPRPWILMTACSQLVTGSPRTPAFIHSRLQSCVSFIVCKSKSH